MSGDLLPIHFTIAKQSLRRQNLGHALHADERVAQAHCVHIGFVSGNVEPQLVLAEAELARNGRTSRVGSR